MPRQENIRARTSQNAGRSDGKQSKICSFTEDSASIMMERPIRAAPERQRGFRQGNRSSGGAGAAKRSRMPRRGCHRQVTGGGKTKVARPSGPHRNVSEVSVRETDAVEVPAQRSGAACPAGAVTAGDWGWTGRISYRNPVINDKILIFRIILLNIISSN